MLKKSAWIVLAAALLTVLPVRLYQLFFLGKGAAAASVTAATVVSAVLAAGTAAVLVLSFLVRKEQPAYRPLHSLPAAVLSVLSGLGLVMSSLVSMASDGSQNQFMYMILSLFGILAGAVLIFTGYGFATGQNVFARHPLAALLPPLWGCVCLFTLFITYVGIVNVAENVYNTLAVAFLLLFLFTQAKLFAGVESEKAVGKIRLLALPAVLFLFATGIPGSVAALAGIQQAGSFPAGLYFVNVVMACNILAFLAAMRRAPKTEEPEESTAPETPKEEEHAGPSEWNLCWELLTKEYESREVFAQRAPSPFSDNKMKIGS